MRLVDLLSTGKKIRSIPKFEIPSLLGEIETLKARLWMRLTEWEGLDSPIVIAKTAKNQSQTTEKPVKQVLHDQIPGPQGRILRLKEVVQMVGLSKSSIWSWQRDGKFPKSHTIGPRSVGWLDTEIHEWIARRFGNGKGLAS